MEAKLSTTRVNTSGESANQLLKRSLMELRKIKNFELVSSTILAKTKYAACGVVGELRLAYLVTYGGEVFVVEDGDPNCSDVSEKYEMPCKKDDKLSALDIEEFGFTSSYLFARTRNGLVYGCELEENVEEETGVVKTTLSPPFEMDFSSHTAFIAKMSCSGDRILCLTLCGKVYSANAARRFWSFDEVEFPAESEMVIGIFLTIASSFAITVDGKVLAWGKNAHGQLGDGTRNARKVPQVISFPDDTAIKQITCGHHHVLALGVDGSLFLWGSNEHGEIGNGTREGILRPTRLNMPTSALEIPRFPLQHMSACKMGEKMYVWGLVGDEAMLVPKETSFDTFQEMSLSHIQLSSWSAEGDKPKTVSSFQSLWHNPRNHNIWFEVKGEVIPGCKIFLERWEGFKSKFAEDWDTSTKENPIVVRNCHPHTFHHFLEFAHSNKLREVCDMEDTFRFELLELATRYGVSPLIRVLEAFWIANMDNLDVVEVYKAASSCKAQELLIASLQFMKRDFFDTIVHQDDETMLKIMADFKILQGDRN